MEPTTVYGAQNASVHENEDVQSAFQYLSSLPANHNRAALEGYKREKGSNIIDHEVAETFTDSFRGAVQPFTIPVSWTMTKESLMALLGITDYTGYSQVNGVRFYAGINPERQLTLVAVSTMQGTGCNEDLTINESYPYYDYADPCPNNCSNRGNLKAVNAAAVRVTVTQ